jgi:hypothetical protein
MLGLRAAALPQVFISYARQSRAQLDELLLDLKPLETEFEFSIWEDASLPPSADFQSEIMDALSRAAVALLLVSPAFLASSFIRDVELPRLLRARAHDDLTLLIVHTESNISGVLELGRYQALNDPRRGIADLPSNERRAVWLRVAEAIAVACRAKAAPVSFETLAPGSTLLREYVLRAQNLKRAYAEACDTAFVQAEIVTNVTAAVLAYNAVYEDLHNRATELVEVLRSHVTSDTLEEVRALFETVIHDVHRSYLLQTNEVRVRMDAVVEGGLDPARAQELTAEARSIFAPLARALESKLPALLRRVERTYGEVARQARRN